MTKLKPEEVRALKALFDALTIFTDIDPNMPVQQIRAFLLVARTEGLGTVELASQAGINHTVMSRHLAELGELNRYKDEGLNWLYQKNDVIDRRARKAFLTPDGVTKRHALVRAMQY